MCDFIGPIYSGYVPFRSIRFVKVRANPVLVVDLEFFKESGLSVKNYHGRKRIELGLLALQVDTLPIELAGPSQVRGFYLYDK